MRILLLGVAQDAGLPQIGCHCDNCELHRKNKKVREFATSLALIYEEGKEFWLIDATPDLREQLEMIERQFPGFKLSGIFLTHAHMGHYTGLMFLGRESINMEGCPVYCTRRMQEYLTHNGPWSQLVQLGNIRFPPFDGSVTVGDAFVFAWKVPHRGEYSDTLAFSVASKKNDVCPPTEDLLRHQYSPNVRPYWVDRWLFYCPDIDRWSGWEFPIRSIAEHCDYLLIDATFFSADELPGRDLSLIPHPLVTTSVDLLEGCKGSVVFVHLNHSNALWKEGGEARKIVEAASMSVGFCGWTLDFVRP